MPVLVRRTHSLRSDFVARDWNHILVTGQSLSIGYAGTPALTTTQPFTNKMFTQGVVPGGSSLTTFAALIEGTSPTDETGWAAAANLITDLADDELGETHNLLVSGHGAGGAAYDDIKKGTTQYNHGMAQVTAGDSVATGLGDTHVVRAVFVVHGETDNYNASSTYEDDLIEWQRDYDADVRAITGQDEPVIMFHSQISSWVNFPALATPSDVAMDQITACARSSGRIVLVCPKYMLTYADGLHLTAESYRHLGELYAKAYRHVVLEGKRWEPVRPTSAIRTGAVIDVKFHVPVRPLVLDNVRVDDPGSAYGFEFTSSGSPPAISSVEVIGPSTVRVTLASTPAGSNQRLRYAWTGTPGFSAGPTTGPRGCLRDSDTTPSLHGNELFNWCVHFDMAVTT